MHEQATSPIRSDDVVRRSWWCRVGKCPPLALAVASLALAAVTAGCGSDVVDPPAAGTDPDPTVAPTVDQPVDQTVAQPVDGGGVVAEPFMTGADMLRHIDDFALLNGRRVGVILNQASTVDGESLLDVLVAAPSVDVVAAFAPEHGIRGTAAAGALVADTTDPTTGVPVYSLYGEQRAPSEDALAEVDVLVFDLQDVGARPYTYISTMGLAMQAAAEAGKGFVVLDRPNPLGGDVLDGPVLDPANASFVGRYPIPLVHGLTVGELALMIAGEVWLSGVDSLQLHVVPMQGWSRADRWPDVERPWIPPSPGLPTAEAAAVYPGTVLFEATSMSVGRGTDEPFTTIGAPWVDGLLLAQRLNELGLPGVRFEPVVMAPVPSESDPDPPFVGEEIGGVRVVVEDGTFRPVETGVHLLVEADAHAADRGAGELVVRPEWLDLLAGTDALRLGLAAGQTAEQLLAAWPDDLTAFDQQRQPYLLYD